MELEKREREEKIELGSSFFESVICSCYSRTSESRKFKFGDIRGLGVEKSETPGT